MSETYKIVHECIKQTNDLGQAVYTNICDGTTQVVPWGSMDWVGNIMLMSVFCIAFVMAIAFIAMMGSLILDAF